ncbi:helix-turn-helix domain-containing protein [Neobacillus niacini]|uniref:helix-turn-helix domain-containing protein n=1 Tax=Neobacillus niacini TaxID=86668 RepID=UPI0021CB8098|nr:helix-turn-helix domain-containing protein [Neobacillus niacini]MCM3768794.1 helix-turn-helix domain-containing protein [Neobacillus niacini]
MKESKVDVILHPVRMRIIQNLINQQLTSQQMKEMLPDIPQASLYRNIKKLVESEVIHVVDEIPIRGTVEKVYSVHDPNLLTISPDEMNKMSKEEHMGFFIKFIANLMGEYERYLSKEQIDLLADGVSFRQTSLFLTDEEFVEFINDLRMVYAKAAQNKPEKGRRKRTVATIMIPEEKE